MKELILIAGPCVIESEEATLQIAGDIKEIAQGLGLELIFKASYDKANRTSVGSYRGPGLKKGLAILDKVKKKSGLRVLSDVHCQADIKPAAKVLDVIQVPAFLSRQTDFIIECAKSGKTVNLKKGQFLAPWDIKPAVDKLKSAGCKDFFITERGTSFGYNNLVSDMRAIPIMQEFGCPIVYDATHSAQLPGGKGESSGGQREFVPILSRAAIAAGADGIFLEVHPDPDNAPCDGPNMLKLRDLEGLLKELIGIREIVID